MYKYKKYTIKLLTLIYIILSIIEIVKYCLVDSCLYGLIYLLITLLIIFLLVPVSYNYNKYYSVARISKLIMIILIGIFNSYILNIIVINNMSYIDASVLYNKDIFVIKNILKGIIYFILVVFTAFEFKLDKILCNKLSNKSKSKSILKEKTRQKKKKVV